MMVSATALQLVFVLFGAVVWSATASIVPCAGPHDHYPPVKGTKFGRCGFLIPNNTAKQELSQDSIECQDFGSFQGTKQGTPFKDPCKPNVTIDKIELTVSKAPLMIRSLNTTYSDGSVYSHGTPTDEVYTIDLTAYNPRLYIFASIVGYSDVVYRITFIAVDRYLKQFCFFGPIGSEDADWKIDYGVVNAFYGSADEGINGLGFYGCMQEPLMDLLKPFV